MHRSCSQIQCRSNAVIGNLQAIDRAAMRARAMRVVMATVVVVVEGC